MNKWNSTFSQKPTKPMKRSWMRKKPQNLTTRQISGNKRLLKPKKKSPKTLKRKLDEIFSTYTRKAAADETGHVTCYCGVRLHWKESDCSHYIPRGCLALRYDPRNTTPSCRRCNRFMGGNLQAYALKLQEDYGLGILQELEREKRKIVKNFPYEAKIAEYTDLLARLS